MFGRERLRVRTVPGETAVGATDFALPLDHLGAANLAGQVLGLGIGKYSIEAEYEVALPDHLSHLLTWA